MAKTKDELLLEVKMWKLSKAPNEVHVEFSRNGMHLFTEEIDLQTFSNDRDATTEDCLKYAVEEYADFVQEKRTTGVAQHR